MNRFVKIKILSHDSTGTSLVQQLLDLRGRSYSIGSTTFEFAISSQQSLHEGIEVPIMAVPLDESEEDTFRELLLLNRYEQELQNLETPCALVLFLSPASDQALGLRSMELKIKEYCKNNSKLSQWLIVNLRSDSLSSYGTTLLQLMCSMVIEQERELTITRAKTNSSPYQTIAQLMSSDNNDQLCTELGLDHKSMELMTKAIVECSRHRRMYPFRDATQSCAMHMALYLRANNPRFSSERIARCEKQLDQFKKESEIISFFAHYNKKRICTVREQIQDEEESQQYANNAQIFDNVKQQTHKIPGSQPF